MPPKKVVPYRLSITEYPAIPISSYNEEEIDREVDHMLAVLRQKAAGMNLMSMGELAELGKFFEDAEEYIESRVKQFRGREREMAGQQYEDVLEALGNLQEEFNEIYHERRMSQGSSSSSFSPAPGKQSKMSSPSAAPLKPEGLYTTKWQHKKKDGTMSTRETIYYSDGLGSGGVVSKKKAFALKERGVRAFPPKEGKGSEYSAARKPYSRVLYNAEGMRYTTRNMDAIEAHSRGRERAKRATLVPQSELKAVAYKHGVSTRVVSDIVRDMDAVAYAELDAYMTDGKKGARGLRYSKYVPTRPDNGRRYRTPQQVYEGFQFPLKEGKVRESMPLFSDSL